MRSKVEQLAGRFDAASLQQLQLQELAVLPGGRVRYCLAACSMLVAPSSATTSTMAGKPSAAAAAAAAGGGGGGLSSVSRSFKQYYVMGAAEGSAAAEQLLQECSTRLADWNGWPAGTTGRLQCGVWHQL